MMTQNAISNIKIYEIKSGANGNYAILFSKDRRFFFWNSSKFIKNKVDDLVFVINRHAGEALFTKIGDTGIECTYNANRNKTIFTYEGDTYEAAGKWGSFVRFDIKISAQIPKEWNWEKQLGQSETFDLWKKGIDDHMARAGKLDDLSKIFTHGEAADVISDCRQKLIINSKFWGIRIKDMDSILQTSSIQAITNDKKFRFENVRLLYYEFLSFTANDKFYEVLLEALKKNTLPYPAFVEHYQNQPKQYSLLLLIGKLLAHIDFHTANLDAWNLYEDKRVFAEAGLTIHNWVNYLIRFKKTGNNYEVLPKEIGNAITYANNSINEIPIISEDHRSLIVEKLLKKAYHQHSFVKDLRLYFDQYDISCTNKANETYLYTLLLHYSPIAEIWKDSIQGLAAIDPNKDNWLGKAMITLTKAKGIVVWWSKLPTGTTQTINRLKRKLSLEKSFNLIYIVDGIAKYKLTVTDLALANDYEQKKWNAGGDIAEHQVAFDNYKDSIHTASIVFLVNDIEIMEPGFSPHDINWYSNYSMPRRNNLQPYTDIQTPQMIVDQEMVPSNLATLSSIPFNHPHRKVYAAVKTKPFILLAGLSGTGKSRLVRTLAYHTCAHINLKSAYRPGNFKLIKVKPNWHDPSELLGYESRINGEAEYVVSDFLIFMVKAWQYTHIPFFLCLDEMNLAPVEQYFAEYLSIVETRGFHEDGMISDAFISADKIRQYADNDGSKNNGKFWQSLEISNDSLLQQQFLTEGLCLPPNLVVMGTVNMDETTHSFSKKVLDRAMTIEMNKVDLREGITKEPEDWSYPDVFIDHSMVLGTMQNGKTPYELLGKDGERVINLLIAINKCFENTSFKIAYRVRNEILIYCAHNIQIEDKPSNWLDICLDEMVIMKILSRIEGDRSKCGHAIDELQKCIPNHFSTSMDKLKEMKTQLDKWDYTSFWSQWN